MDEVRRVPRMWWGGLLLAGLLALLWGTGTAVAADAVRGAEQRMIAAAEVGDLIITGVTIAGPNSTITITNVSGADIDLEGTFVCNFPSYFRLGAFALADGDSVTVSAEAGSDGNGVIFAAGGFGELGSPGEVALYKNEGFGDSSAIIAYVGWNGGLLRKGVAQAAGLWGDVDLEAGSGDRIRKTGAGTGADAYSVSGGGGGGAVTALPSTGSGGLADGDGGVAPFTWALLAAGLTLVLGVGGGRAMRRRAR